MEINIFDVSHGFCALLIADNGNVMLFDCGHNEQSGFRPSAYLIQNGVTVIDRLVIQNFDQDHVSDLPNILDRLSVTMFTRNRSMTPEQLRGLKVQSGPLTTAMSKAIDMHRDFIHKVTVPPSFPNIEFRTFANSYPTFEDTNNLSLVSFIHYGGMGIVFPGDMEKAGWEVLLRDAEFREHLARVNIFVASHHGRANGYCEAVFDHCSPDIVIISDKEIVHETQKQQYGKHATGLPWNQGSERRYVLTTRSDGIIKISKSLGHGYHISI